jgi:hypothetical protein
MGPFLFAWCIFVYVLCVACGYVPLPLPPHPILALSVAALYQSIYLPLPPPLCRCSLEAAVKAAQDEGALAMDHLMVRHQQALRRVVAEVRLDMPYLALPSLLLVVLLLHALHVLRTVLTGAAPSVRCLGSGS